MAHDYQWHRTEVRKRRARDWNNVPDPEARPRGPWLLIGLIVALGVTSGMVIARGIGDADRSRYDRLMSNVDIGPAEAPSPPRG
jgi:hypothetical protein